MVIYLDKTIGEHLKNNEIISGCESLFSMLALNYKFGKCYLCGELETLEFLSKIDGETGELYHKMMEHYSETVSIVSSVEKVVVLTMDDSFELPSFLLNKGCKIRVDQAIQTSMTFNFTLVCENLSDCDFYRLIAKKYMTDRGFRGVQLSMRKENGGGTTTKDIFRKCVIEDHDFVLCIVDSDKKDGYTSKSGDTLKKVLGVKNELEKLKTVIPFEVLPLEVHEVENLIPIGVLMNENLLKQLPDMRKGIDLLLELKKIDNAEPILFYDFKKGYPFGKDYDKYWSSIYDKLDNNYTENKDKGSIFINISNNKLLERTIKIIEEDPSKVIVDDYLQKIWETIGHKLYTWGCANTAVRG